MVKVAVIGAAGGIGQPLSLLLKLNPAVTALSLIDVVPLVKGVAVDLSHIPTASTITATVGTDPRPGLGGCQLLMIPAGMPRKPGMTRDDLFNINAKIVKGIAEAVAEVCPRAFIGLITNPVNSMVPVFVETLRAKGIADAHLRVFGVTQLDLLRASTFSSSVVAAPHPDPAGLAVPVVGGHAGTTIVPLFSQASGAGEAAVRSFVTSGDIAALVKRTQFGGDEVVTAKDGAGSATLSMAQAANVFATGVIKAIVGLTVPVVAFVESPLFAAAGTKYFASTVTVGPNGITDYPPLPTGLSDAESAAIRAAVAELKEQVDKGIAFVKDAK